MNILIIYPHGNALNPISGAETRIYSIIDSLVNNNFNVLILHSRRSNGFEDKRLKEKCKVYYYKEFRFFGLSDWYFSDLNPFYVIKIFQIIRKKNLDIIQLEYPWGFLILKLIVKNSRILIYDSQDVESDFIKITMKLQKFLVFFTIL